MVTSQVMVFNVMKWLQRGLVTAYVNLQNKATQKVVRCLEFEASSNRQAIRVQESRSWHRQWFLWKRSRNQQRCCRRRCQWIHEGNVSSRLRRWLDSVNRRLYERGKNGIFSGYICTLFKVPNWGEKVIDFSLFCSTFRVDAMRTIAVQLKHLYCAGTVLEKP